MEGPEAASKVEEREELDLLAGLPIFKGLTHQQLRAVRRIMKRRRCSTGHIILREGAQGDTMYVLVSGSVEVSKTLTLRLAQGGFGESEKTLVRLSAHDGAFFGEMGILEDSERSATVSALGPCEMLEISKADFERLSEADPYLGYRVAVNIARILATRLRNTNQDVLKLTTALSIALRRR